MAFFEEIGKRLTDAGQNVAKQTKNLADVTQLNSGISDREKKISQLYLAIGQAYYEENKDDSSAKCREMMDEITGLYEEIEQSREKIKEIKGIVKCPNCGADVPINAAFCSSCGIKMEDVAAQGAVAEEQRICPACQKEVPAGNAFCNHCGAKMEE